MIDLSLIQHEVLKYVRDLFLDPSLECEVTPSAISTEQPEGDVAGRFLEPLFVLQLSGQDAIAALQRLEACCTKQVIARPWEAPDATDWLIPPQCIPSEVPRGDAYQLRFRVVAPGADDNLRHKSRALILKGGGAKGAVYAGALEVLVSREKYDWFAGTSSGALVGCLLAAGVHPTRLTEILTSTDFGQFMPGSRVAAVVRLLWNKWMYTGDEIVDWVDQILAEELGLATRVRMQDVPTRLTIFASAVGTTRLVFDSLTTPEVPVAHAVRCSVSLPFIFRPMSQDGANTYDGGLFNNYPVDAMREIGCSDDFRGLYIGSRTFEGVRRREKILDFIGLSTEEDDWRNLRAYRDNTIILDSRPIGTLRFALSAEEKAFLLAEGRVSAAERIGFDNSAVREQRVAVEEQRSQLYRQAAKRRKYGCVLAFLVAAILCCVCYLFVRSLI